MNTSNKLFLTTHDFLVTEKEFQLLHDPKLDMLVTFPQPDKDELYLYYESEKYISHTDSKNSLVDKIYHLIKKHALSRKVSLIEDENKHTGKLLDIGAGTGDFLLAAKNKHWEVYGVEPSNTARNLSDGKNISLHENLSQLKETGFDVITLWHVLEHLPDLDIYISEIHNRLKPGGTLIIAVPNFKSYDAQHYKEFWAAYDVPRHLWHFSKNSVKNLFESNGFVLTKTKPMIFDSFYVSMLSEKYKNKKGNLIKAFLIGLWSNLNGVISKEYSSHIYILKKGQ